MIFGADYLSFFKAIFHYFIISFIVIDLKPLIGNLLLSIYLSLTNTVLIKDIICQSN